MPLAAPLVLALALCCARAEIHRNRNAALEILLHNSRAIRALDAESPAGCLYEGRWFVPGARVAVRDACLRCACSRGGALACARAACAPAPRVPPRCHLRHRRDACCPELHCPDGVTVLELDAAARIEPEEQHLGAALPACASGGALYAAGSALAGGAACEQCFCLGGARRCVRPRCVPAPPACRARPAPGACCPDRYYCDPPHNATADATRAPHRIHDCEVDGVWVSEGARVEAGTGAGAGAGAGGDSCRECFCLRGEVRCAAAGCAAPAPGCTPLRRAGRCCPHAYRCGPAQPESVPHHYKPISHNALIATRYEDRSFHSTDSNKHETTTKLVTTSAVPTRNIPAEPHNKQQHISTIKVKRKTNDLAPTTAGMRPRDDTTKTTDAATQKLTTTAAKLVASTVEVPTTGEPIEKTTEQPEASVKIVINGTINCTAEISSTSLPLNTTTNDVEKINLEAQSRIPNLGDGIIEAHTSNPNDIITDRNVNGGFDENETFTINVTSSLRTNTSHSTSAPSMTTLPKADMSTDLTEAQNISKKTKEDYDYDYTEPTLPPSLPNLKIIPFVAADAVVDDDAPSKETFTYPLSDREDKFPVYYPSSETKETPFANRRKDVYHPTQYPVFVNGKVEAAQYPTLTHDMDFPSAEYPIVNNDVLTSPHEYTVTAALGNRAPEANRVVTKPPSESSTYELKTPPVNLFSPPIETEGGFIPKGPGIGGEYYAVYPSTPSAPSVPHLTTSMQLDTGKGDCVTSDGRRVAEGEAVSLACASCACARGRLQCAPRPCAPAPPACARRPATTSAGDMCCGEIVCPQDHSTSPASTLTTQEVEITLNESKVPIEIQSEILLFDPPPDRSVPPVVNNTITEKNLQVNREESVETVIEAEVISQKLSTVASTRDSEINDSIVKETSTRNSVTSKSTEKPVTTTLMATTADVPGQVETNDTKNQSQEYEDDEEDEGFSFGSVLKLLLSDSYDSTTSSPYKKKPTMLTTTTTKVPFTTTTSSSSPKLTTRRMSIKPAVAPFFPMPHHPYAPPKKLFTQNTVNRIDHLVLGEATAIKMSTPRPVPTSYRPVTASFKPFTIRTTSPKSTTKFEVTKKEEHSDVHTSVAHEGSRPAGLGVGPGVSSGVGPGVGPSVGPGAGQLPAVGGLLKLAGCNIYGRMYRVGRIIAELSSPCQECRCTELGVQCHALSC